jgi:hypothetical protein
MGKTTVKNEHYFVCGAVNCADKAHKTGQEMMEHLRDVHRIPAGARYTKEMRAHADYADYFTSIYVWHIDKDVTIREYVVQNRDKKDSFKYM